MNYKLEEIIFCNGYKAKGLLKWILLSEEVREIIIGKPIQIYEDYYIVDPVGLYYINIKDIHSIPEYDNNIRNKSLTKLILL